MGITVKLVAVTVVAPYLLGWMISSVILPANYFVLEEEEPDQLFDDSTRSSVSRVTENSECSEILDDVLKEKPFDGVTLVVHRNGEPKACGSSAENPDINSAMKAAADTFDYCPDEYDKYDFESFLTTTLAMEVLPPDSCESLDDSRGPEGLLGFCDMGEDRTPILLDHEYLVPIPSRTDEGSSLPCHFHTREGVRITSMEQLIELSQKAQADKTCQAGDENCPPAANAELHLYAVPAGRVFMFAPSYVGEIFELPHVSVSSGLPVYLEVLSVSPRVFDIFNFYDKDESDALIKRALAETTDSHRLKRSTTGASSNQIFSKRTSESGFDTHGDTAQKVKRRCMSVLGYDEYLEGHTDGLQILRYNLTKAYVPHMDYLDADRYEGEGFDFDSTGVGGNRYATILLYMSDLGEQDGGETVFAKAWPPKQPEEERVKLPQALKELRESGEAGSLTEGSWEEEMAAQCRTKLAIRPNSARAVLFYSMHPDGRPDKASLHGGCPVLRGEKWAANLWVWNTPREGFEGAPYKNYGGDNVERNAAPDNGPQQLSAQFVNSGENAEFDMAELYYEDTYWGSLEKGGKAIVVNTYQGHRWNVRVDGKVVKNWVVGPEPAQEFRI